VALVAAFVLSAGAASAAAVVPDGGFVIHGSTPEVKRQIDIAHDAGARWISLATTWAGLEPAQDAYPDAAWADLADQLTYAKSRSMNVELRLVDAPSWASGRSGSENPPTPAHYGDYASFLTDLGTRLGAYIDAYSPWNEPNRAAFWNPVDPDAFTALQMAAYPGIKAGDPTATVVYGPVVGRFGSQNSGYTFLRRSYELGARGSFDVIGWNGYPAGPPESDGPVTGGEPAANTLPAQQYLRGIIDRFDPGRKVWLLELGWSTCAPCDVSAANGVGEAQQADYLTRAFEYRRRYLASFVERMFWYQLRDAGTNRGAWEQNQGLVRRDFSAKPALAAFSALSIDDPDGVLPPTGGTGPGAIPPASLPRGAASLGLPSAARGAAGRRVALGRPALSLKDRVFRLAFRVTVAGGRSTVRVDGYRARAWRRVAVLRVARSGRVTIRVRDTGFAAFRIRATVPGRAGFRSGRLVKVPPRLFRTASPGRP